VEPGGGADRYGFAVPIGGCGTNLLTKRNTEISSAENVIIVQMDPLVQEVWDSARRISCSWDDSYRKSISFQPFSVGMLAVEKGHDTSNVNCWMDIKSGRYPKTLPLEGITQIGEPLSILIFLSDKGENKFDVKAQDCWAYDSEYFDDPSTTKIQLTGRDGCPVKRKLIGDWEKTRTVLGNSGADLILYNIVNAFKFPDNAQVYITCNVEICRGRCDNECSGIAASSTTARTAQITARPFQLIVKPTTPRPEVVGTTPPDDSSLFNDPNLITHSCGHGENDQRCRQPKIIDVNATEGLNLGTTTATQEAKSEEDPSTGQGTNIDTEKTTQSFTEEIGSTTQVPITSTIRTTNIFFTTPKILVITPKVKIEEENGHFTTVTSKTMMQFHPGTEHENDLQRTEKPKSFVTFSPLTKIKQDNRQPKLVTPNILFKNEISQPKSVPPKTFVQFQPSTKSKEENPPLNLVTPKTLVQFSPPIQPFTPLDAFNPPKQEITTEHMKIGPNKIRTKSPRIPFFGPNSFRPSPKIPSNMFVPVRPIGKQQSSNCDPGSKSPECAVLVQNVTFKTVKPFIRAEATRPPSTFQGLPPSVSPTCFPGSLNPSCHHHEACRKFPQDKKCQNYERCRMIARNPDCKAHICQIAPNSNECKLKRKPKVLTGPPLTKINKPCDSSDPSCILANFFLRPLNCDNNPKDPRCRKFFQKNPKQQINAIVGLKHPTNGNALRDQKTITQINLDAFCRNGNPDPRCKLKAISKFKPANPQTNPSINGNHIVKIPNIMTTNVPKTPTSIFSMKETFNQTNAKNKFQPNIPLNETVKAPTTLMPIHKNMFVDFTTETPETNNFRTTRPKEMFKVANHLNTKPFVSTQIICNQNPFDARCSTIPRQPIQCIPGSDSKQCLHQKPFTIRKEPNPQIPKEIFSNQPKTPNSNSLELKCSRQPDGSVLCDTDPQNCFPGSQDPACQQIGISPICYDGSLDKRCQLQGNLVRDQGVACLPSNNSPDCQGHAEQTNTRTKPSKGMFVDPIKINNHDCQPGSTDLECFIGTSFHDPNSTDSGDPIGMDKYKAFGINCVSNPNLPMCRLSGIKKFELVKTNKPKMRFVYEMKPTVEKKKRPAKIFQFIRNPLVNQIQENQSDLIRQEGPIKNSKLKEPNIVDNHFTSNPSKPNKEKNVGHSSQDPMISGPRDPKTSLSVFNLKFPNTPGSSLIFPKPTIKQLPLVKASCFRGSKDPDCWPTPSPSHCSPNSNHPICRLPPCRPGDTKCRINGYGTICFPQSGDPRCLKSITCLPGSQDPVCVLMENLKPLNCGEFPNDLRCREKNPPKICLPGSKDTDCQFDPGNKNIFETCGPGSNEPECSQENVQINKNKICSKESSDSECRPNEQDRKKTSQKKICIVGTSDEDCWPVDEQDNVKKDETKVCIPGSGDVNCWPFNQDKNKKICFPGSSDKWCLKNLTVQDTKNACLPGSDDPNCELDKQEKRDPKKICIAGSRELDCIQEDPSKSETDVKNNCEEGSGDPRCWPIQSVESPKEEGSKPCLIGSKDFKCLQFKDYTRENIDPKLSNANTCIYGSGDPACWPFDVKIENCKENFTDPNCLRHLNRCIPGSQHPACNLKIRCEPGSNNPECLNSTPIPNKEVGKHKDLIICDENPSNPQCFADKDQKEREKLCKLIPSNPICQTLDIVPTNQKIECSPDSTDPICRPVIQDIVFKDSDPSKKSNQCEPGSTEPRCTPVLVKSPLKEKPEQYQVNPNKFSNFKPFKSMKTAPENQPIIAIKNVKPPTLVKSPLKKKPEQFQLNPNKFSNFKPFKPMKVTPDNQPIIAIKNVKPPTLFKRPLKEKPEQFQVNPDKFRNFESFKPMKITPDNQPTITIKNVKPFTAFSKPIDPNNIANNNNGHKDPSEKMRQQEKTKDPEDNKLSFKTPPIVQQKTQKDPRTKTGSKDLTFKVLRPNTRKPKQFVDSSEPVAEPEPGDDYHSPGSNPRTHAFHSWLYQKIDPKVRAARRKKFFGSGRKKRQISDDLLEIYSIESKQERTGKPTQNKDPSFHAFHLWQRQKVDQTKSARRRKLLREGRSFGLLQQKPHSIAKRDSNGEKISINLGVKRITIDDSLLDILPPETHRRTFVEQKSRGAESPPEVKYIMVPNSTVAVTFCMFVMLFFLALSVVFSTVFQHKRYIIRKL